MQSTTMVSGAPKRGVLRRGVDMTGHHWGESVRVRVAPALVDQSLAAVSRAGGSDSGPDRNEVWSLALHRRNAMKAIKKLWLTLVRDEQGGEVLEYALIAGLIVVAAIAVISSVGTKVLGRWTSLNSSM